MAHPRVMRQAADFMEFARPSLFTASVTTKQLATFVKRKTSMRPSDSWPGQRAATEVGTAEVLKQTQSERRARRDRRRRLDQRKGEREILGGAVKRGAWGVGCREKKGCSGVLEGEGTAAQRPLLKKDCRIGVPPPLLLHFATMASPLARPVALLMLAYHNNRPVTTQ